jgi:CheY-like chemotaxis protein
MDTIELLLVEDNPGDALLLTEAFDRSALPYRMTLLRNGAEALDFLFRRGNHREAGRPALVILDFNLPLANALEIMQEVRTEPALDDLPIVLMSGSNLDPALRAAIGLADDRFILKPSTFQGYLDLANRLGSLATQPKA